MMTVVAVNYVIPSQDVGSCLTGTDNVYVFDIIWTIATILSRWSRRGAICHAFFVGSILNWVQFMVQVLLTVQPVRKWCHEFANGRTNILDSLSWKIFPHPTHSHDFTPSDFCSFPKLKRYLWGGHFHLDDDIKEAVTDWLHQQDVSFYYQSLDSLIHRYNKCLNKQGDWLCVKIR